MKNLRDVYNKNQEVLRQIKTLKVAGKYEPKPPLKTQSSAYQINVTSQEKTKSRAVQKQQEELRKILFQSQMKNLQIQQKLQQKSELHMQALLAKAGMPNDSPVAFDSKKFAVPSL